MHNVQGCLAHKKKPPFWVPTVESSLRPHGSPRGGGAFLCARYPCTECTCPLSPPLLKHSLGGVAYNMVEGRVGSDKDLSRTVSASPLKPQAQISPPQTPKPKPPTPNPKPQTPNPNPQTPNPKPQSPNPRSQTPNPKPQTRNPKLQTPNPELKPQPLTPNLVFQRTKP